ncbi:MAG: hypothetical protein U0V70_04055 [Terriglobia bacterium]
MKLITCIFFLLLFTLVYRGAAVCGQETPESFYIPENPAYTVTDSARDSARFTLEKTVKPGRCGHLVSISSFVNPEGEIMGWHDFGNLEGPGWAANAVGGAWELYRLGERLGNARWQKDAIAILDHVLDCGFIRSDGFIRNYRETTTGDFCLNYKHRSDWFCPGSMAKIGFQLLLFADALQEDPRATRMRDAARRCAEWIHEHVKPTPNGWFPRRTSPDGQLFRQSPKGKEDPFWQSSADGLYILQLEAALTERHLADYRVQLRAGSQAFMEAGGHFASLNHDTYDLHENVAYSVAFRTLLSVSHVLGDPAIRAFAYDKCLAGLGPFKMREDRNGVATKGLLYMEASWDTAYLWENAEAALALFEAARDLRTKDAARSRQLELDGLTILRAIAKHHYGRDGFLTEGVDWNNHVGEKHHIGQVKYGAIQYTEPFLNNQHILEPTVFYLEQLATQKKVGNSTEWRDLEGNLILMR